MVPPPVSSLSSQVQPASSQLVLEGLSVTPHVMAESMRYRHDPELAVDARVQLFLRNDRIEPLSVQSTDTIRSLMGSLPRHYS